MMTNNETTVRLLNQSVLEPVSAKAFGDFLKNNIPLVIAVSFALVFSYGPKLFWYQEGQIEDMSLIANKNDFLLFVIGTGRFSQALLIYLFNIQGYNPFTVVFTGLCLFLAASLSWCYIIAVFNGCTARNNRLIPFALLFCTQPILNEMLTVHPHAIWFALILGICPYAVYFLYKGLLDNKKKNIISAVAALVFMLSIYQAIVALFCGGVFACFLLLQERTNYDAKVYSRLCLKLLLSLLLAGALFYLINRFIVYGLLGFSPNEFLDDVQRWKKRPVIQSILAILLYGYTLTIGQIPFVQSIVHPIIKPIELPLLPSVETIAHFSRVYGNALLLPAAVLFLVSISQKARGMIPNGRRLLYVLAGIGVPFTVIMLSLIGGSRTPYRASWGFCFAAAFMVYYLLRVWNRKAAYVLTILALIVAARQAQISAQVLYSGQLRYIADTRLAGELGQLIRDVQPDNQKLPVALVGFKSTVEDMPPYYLWADMMGVSLFSLRGNNRMGENEMGLAFMQSQGMYYDIPDKRQWETAIAEAASMPSYPDPGCAKRLSDIVVVKLSDTR